MVEERLEAYYQRNRRLPKHILFYRDGVGETQYGMVLREELPQVRVACTRMATKYDGNSPLITLLVVGKRHHARFFPEIPLNAPANGRNLIAGTVVDRNVNDPNRTNFYLQSHDSALGTARTGHYVVIVDESAYGLDRLERVVSNHFAFMHRNTFISSCSYILDTNDFLIDEQYLLYGISRYEGSLGLYTSEICRYLVHTPPLLHVSCFAQRNGNYSN